MHVSPGVVSTIERYVQVTGDEDYLSRCAHGSSLAHAAFGMLAVQVGETEEDFRHFGDTSTVDLHNTHKAVVTGTFVGGIHTAACGGTYQLAVNVFGSPNFHDDELVIAPHLPDPWKSLGFPISWRGDRRRVRRSHSRIGRVTTARSMTATAQPMVTDSACSSACSDA